MSVTRSGKLKVQYLPAVYFDSSVLIDYWLTEGSEIERPEDLLERTIKENEPKNVRVLRDLLKSDKYIRKMAEVRKKLLYGNPKVTAVVSPLSLLELMEWNAESAFKETAIEAVDALAMQRKGKKEIGTYLKKLLELRRDEVSKQERTKREFSTVLEIIMGDTWLNRGFVECHGLWGLLQADIVNFKLTIDSTWHEPSAYAYLQLGISDIMHILLAKHLGCEYLASFDSDFLRVADIIQKEAGMRVLPTPEDILRIL